jgi:hypothetical protein
MGKFNHRETNDAPDIGVEAFIHGGGEGRGGSQRVVHRENRAAHVAAPATQVHLGSATRVSHASWDLEELATKPPPWKCTMRLGDGARGEDTVTVGRGWRQHGNKLGLLYLTFQIHHGQQADFDKGRTLHCEGHHWNVSHRVHQIAMERKSRRRRHRRQRPTAGCLAGGGSKQGRGHPGHSRRRRSRRRCDRACNLVQQSECKKTSGCAHRIALKPDDRGAAVSGAAAVLPGVDVLVGFTAVSPSITGSSSSSSSSSFAANSSSSTASVVVWGGCSVRFWRVSLQEEVGQGGNW